jgi:hypothetical protein
MMLPGSARCAHPRAAENRHDHSLVLNAPARQLIWNGIAPGNS